MQDHHLAEEAQKTDQQNQCKAANAEATVEVDANTKKTITVEVSETPSDEFCPESKKKNEKADKETVEYGFVSEYHQYDVVETMEELFPVGSFKFLKYVEAPNPVKSADRDCIVSFRKTPGQSIIWPQMTEDQAAVLR